MGDVDCAAVWCKSKTPFPAFRATASDKDPGPPNVLRLFAHSPPPFPRGNPLGCPNRKRNTGSRHTLAWLARVLGFLLGLPWGMIAASLRVAPGGYFVDAVLIMDGWMFLCIRGAER